MTTVTLSDALKSELERIRDEREIKSLDETINHVLDNPVDGHRPLHGDAARLTEPVKVTDETKERVRTTKEMGKYRDYEAVLRDKVGAAPRDTGEEPVDVRPLDG